MTSLVGVIGRRESARASLAWDVFFVVLGSAVIAALAQVSIPLRPVPVTGQTLGVLLVATALGPVRGPAAVLLYLGEGAVGLPVFAEAKSGAGYLIFMDPAHTTGGYLWGFALAAVVLGWLARMGWDRGVVSALAAMLVGEVVIFACGIAWLAAALGVPLDKALEFGLYPFVLGEIVKLSIAAGLLPGAWRLVGHSE